MLTNPAYAGAYIYGRRAIDPRRQRPGHPGTGRIKRQPGGMVLLKDRLPAYISWDDHERNQAQVSANRSQHAGVPAWRPGAAGRPAGLRPMRPAHGRPTTRNADAACAMPAREWR